MTPADRLALTDLVHRYAAYVDDRQFALAAALFTDDGVLVVPDPPDCLDPVITHPRDSIEAALGAVPATFHAVVGIVLSDEPPRGRIACVAHHLLRPDLDLVWHLRYLDSYAQVDGSWRIARRELHLDLIETRPVKRSRAMTPRGR